MALFTVQPGRSFHSVQEVYAVDKPRLSISGWYHGCTPPDGADAASLNQLKGKAPPPSGPARGKNAPLDSPGKSGGPVEVGAGGLRSEQDYVTGNAAPLPGVGTGSQGAGRAAAVPEGSTACMEPAGAEEADMEFTAEEQALLQRWINPVYLGRSAERKMVAQWEATSCVELRRFLRDDVAAPVRLSLCRFAEVAGDSVPSQNHISSARIGGVSKARHMGAAQNLQGESLLSAIQRFGVP